MNLRNIRTLWLIIISLFLISAGILLVTFSFSTKPQITPQSVSTGQPDTEYEAQGETATLGTKNLNLEGESVKVIRVVDGDTIEIEGGQAVRYIGIDTPETVHPQKTV